MCEILFRGKRKDNGEWVEGSAINTQYDVRGEKHIYIGVLTESEMFPLMQTITWYEVIPETVGPCIGLTDRNGNKVFRGDILKSHWDEDYPEDFCYEVVLWYDNGWCIKQGTATPDRLDGIFKNDCL